MNSWSRMILVVGVLASCLASIGKRRRIWCNTWYFHFRKTQPFCAGQPRRDTKMCQERKIILWICWWLPIVSSTHHNNIKASTYQPTGKIWKIYIHQPTKTLYLWKDLQPCWLDRQYCPIYTVLLATEGILTLPCGHSPCCTVWLLSSKTLPLTT